MKNGRHKTAASIREGIRSIRKPKGAFRLFPGQVTAWYQTMILPYSPLPGTVLLYHISPDLYISETKRVLRVRFPNSFFCLSFHSNRDWPLPYLTNKSKG